MDSESKMWSLRPERSTSPAATASMSTLHSARLPGSPQSTASAPVPSTLPPMKKTSATAPRSRSGARRSASAKFVIGPVAKTSRRWPSAKHSRAVCTISRAAADGPAPPPSPASVSAARDLSGGSAASKNSWDARVHAAGKRKLVLANGAARPAATLGCLARPPVQKCSRRLAVSAPWEALGTQPVPDTVTARRSSASTMQE
mmetsp:Transcript_37931/g.118324  ORF Transcript_37931/g.118324 Transcript_37931/m.118324 type:complete len:202 (+) Transcript_37931:764-1369(+)